MLRAGRGNSVSIVCVHFAGLFFRLRRFERCSERLDRFGGDQSFILSVPFEDYDDLNAALEDYDVLDAWPPLGHRIVQNGVLSLMVLEDYDVLNGWVGLETAKRSFYRSHSSGYDDLNVWGMA